MTTTDSNGIVRYQTTDPVSPLQTLLNLGMQSVSDAITALKSGTAGTAYVPAITGPGTINYGTGATRTGAYIQTGKLTTGYAQISLGTGASFSSGDWRIGLPTFCRYSQLIGSAWMIQSTGLNKMGVITSTAPAGNSAVVRPEGVYYSASATQPWTWSAGDVLSVNFSYESM